MRSKLLGADHPLVATSLNNLADVLVGTRPLPRRDSTLGPSRAVEEKLLRATSSETRMRAALMQVRGSRMLYSALAARTATR